MHFERLVRKEISQSIFKIDVRRGQQALPLICSDFGTVNSALCKARPGGQLLQRRAELFFLLSFLNKLLSARENRACSLPSACKLGMSSSPWRAPSSVAGPPKRATLRTDVATTRKNRFKEQETRPVEVGPFLASIALSAAPPMNHTTDSGAPSGQPMS